MPPPLPSPELQPPPAGWAAAVPQLRKMTKLKLIQSLTSFSFCCYRAKRGRERRPELNLEIGQYQKQHPGLDRQGKRTMLWPCHFVISPDYFPSTNLMLSFSCFLKLDLNGGPLLRGKMEAWQAWGNNNQSLRAFLPNQTNQNTAEGIETQSDWPSQCTFLDQMSGKHRERY